MKRLEDFEEWPEVEDKGRYEKDLKDYNLRMLNLQQFMHQNRRKAVLAFEGWDAGGKGGAIRRLTEPLDPRGYTVHPIGPPTPDELARHYLWRFFERLPMAGQIALFDRTWYGRVLVERIENLCGKKDWQRAYDELNWFEKLLTDDNTPVIKVFFHISKKEQRKRFDERKSNPMKSWKLTDSDWRAHEQYKDYYKAFNDMLAKTDTEHAPWNVISANRKWYARLRVNQLVITSLEKAFGIKK